MTTSDWLRYFPSILQSFDPKPRQFEHKAYVWDTVWLISIVTNKNKRFFLKSTRKKLGKSLKLHVYLNYKASQNPQQNPQNDRLNSYILHVSCLRLFNYYSRASFSSNFDVHLRKEQKPDQKSKCHLISRGSARARWTNHTKMNTLL